MIEIPREPPPIELGSIRLRPLLPSDADDLFTYLSDPVVTQLTAYPQVTAALAEEIIARSQSRWAAGELAKWGIALRENDQIIGTCGFNEHSAAHRWAELAYDLAAPFWGKGLMRQAVAAAMDWSFQMGELERIHAYVRVDNKRSARLLDRMGFICEGRLRNFRFCLGTPHDYHIYSLLRSDGSSSRLGGTDV